MRLQCKRRTPMSASEITTVTHQYRERITAILTPDEITQYDAYEQRMQAQIAARDLGSFESTPAEQAVLTKIAAATRSSARGSPPSPPAPLPNVGEGWR